MRAALEPERVVAQGDVAVTDLDFIAVVLAHPEVMRYRSKRHDPCGQSSAAIDDRQTRPEDREPASDQLAGNPTVDRHRQMPAKENQAV
jgi:hypothetical protein